MLVNILVGILLAAVTFWLMGLIGVGHSLSAIAAVIVFALYVARDEIGRRF
jgi:O-antigen/teichoic acid export membrane protein